MSLRAFHILFITVSIVLLVGFGLWSLLSDAGANTLIGVTSLVCAIILALYGKWFVTKVKAGIEKKNELFLVKR